jgi:LysM repeat protein
LKRALVSAVMAAAAASTLPATAAWASPATGTSDTVQSGQKSYTVVPGDSYWSIGNHFGVNMYDLAAFNHRDLWAALDSGWVLQIPPAGWHGNTSSTPVATAYTPRSTSYSAPATGGIWACIAQHESGGNPATDTGNGYYGMYQFTMSSWQAGGGTGNPADASAAQQTAVAQRVQAQQGWGAWPVTAAECGA